MHLGRSLINPQRANLAIEPLDHRPNAHADAAEHLHRPIDDALRAFGRAVQMFGGIGVSVGSVVERLYREIRPLRIYEGATEVQKLIIGRELLK